MGLAEGKTQAAGSGFPSRRHCSINSQVLADKATLRLERSLFWTIELPPIETVHDPNVITSNMLPLER